MAKIRFSAASAVPPERVLQAAIDFSDRRPDVWPNLDRHVYRVLSRSATHAEVKEGSAIMGGIWARERYDWSVPGVVRATVQDSNVFRPGGIWELRVRPRSEGGSYIEILNHRQARGLKGRLLGALMTVVGAKAVPEAFQRTLQILEREAHAAQLSPRA